MFLYLLNLRLFDSLRYEISILYVTDEWVRSSDFI